LSGSQEKAEQLGIPSLNGFGKGTAEARAAVAAKGAPLPTTAKHRAVDDVGAFSYGFIRKCLPQDGPFGFLKSVRKTFQKGQCLHPW
jgi:hypothetical protein